MHGAALSSHRLTTRGDKASWHISLDIESGVDLENLILSFGNSLRCPRRITDTCSHTCSDVGLSLWQNNLEGHFGLSHSSLGVTFATLLLSYLNRQVRLCRGLPQVAIHSQGIEGSLLVTWLLEVLPKPLKVQTLNLVRLSLYSADDIGNKSQLVCHQGLVYETITD